MVEVASFNHSAGGSQVVAMVPPSTVKGKVWVSQQMVDIGVDAHGASERQTSVKWRLQREEAGSQGDEHQGDEHHEVNCRSMSEGVLRVLLVPQSA
jgi:hypothetical protein